VRLPLSLLTLSASEFQIQKLESGLEFEAYVRRMRQEIASARQDAAAADDYQEFRRFKDRADELEAELTVRLERRRLQREAAGGRAKSARCHSRSKGEAIVTECD